MKTNHFFSLFAIVFFSGFAFSQSNPNNKFDYVGNIHNQVVSEFVSQTQGQKLSNKEVLDKVKTITLSNVDYKKRFGSEYFGLTEKQANDGIKDFPNEFKNEINKLPISSEAKTIFNELVGKTFEIEKSQLSYADYQKYVVDLETEIINNSTLDKKEKDAILYSTSIARYSSYLWIDKNQNTTSKKFFGWVIAGDVVGGIVGGIFGGVGGAIGGASGGSSLVHTINESK